MNALAEPVANNAGVGLECDPVPAVVCAALMPHAPILVPAVGGKRGEAAAASCRAMREAVGRILSQQPETIVVISPHAPRKSGAFGLWAEDSIAGSFEQFGSLEARVTLPNDRNLAHLIATEAHARNVPTWFIRHRPLDHGALVPLWFLTEAGWTGPTALISLNYPEEGGLTSLGEAIAGAAKKSSRRIAIIASGDMSHRLAENAPGGFHPQAHHFDEIFIQLIRAGDYRKMLGINSDLRQLAAEDAVDSTVIAAAAVGWSAIGHEVLNYECPFGVGYGVAILFAAGSKSPTAEPVAANPDGAGLPKLARQSVAAAMRGGSGPAPAASVGYLSRSHGVFVTIRQRNGALRGCIGTLAPLYGDLVAETWHNARRAAFNDSRFPPVTAAELDDLQFHVSVVHSTEAVSPPDGLNPQRYGVIIATADGRRGVLLPAIADVNTVKQQLRLVRRKGGIEPDEPVKTERFQVDHFEETT